MNDCVSKNAQADKAQSTRRFINSASTFQFQLRLRTTRQQFVSFIVPFIVTIVFCDRNSYFGCKSKYFSNILQIIRQKSSEFNISRTNSLLYNCFFRSLLAVLKKICIFANKTKSINLLRTENSPIIKTYIQCLQVLVRSVSPQTTGLFNFVGR